MIDNLFKFLEKNETVLSEDLKKTISESFDLALKEKSEETKGLLKEAAEEIKAHKGLLKEAAEEIKALRTSKVEEVKKTVKQFEEGLVNKLDKYLEHKLKNMIPQTLLEAQAKVEVYEPLVESLKNAFETKGIKIDDKGYAVLKEAKSEILSQKSKYDTVVKEKLDLEIASEKLLGKYLLKEKCEGLTSEQIKRVNILLEDASYDDIVKRFDTIRKIVINEQVKEKKPASRQITTDVISKEQNTEDLGQRLI